MPSKQIKEPNVKLLMKRLAKELAKVSYYVASHNAIFAQEINMSEYEPVPREKSLTVIKQ